MTQSGNQGRLARLRDRDHTRGSLLTSLITLAVPLLGSSLLGGVLFQLGDLKLVSGLGESAVTAVIVTNQSWKQVLIMVVMGASFGAQGLIARHIGGGDTDGADHVAGQLVLLGLVLSTVVGLFGFFFAESMLAAMNVSDEVLAVGTPYMRLVFVLNFGFVFIFLFNSILNGAGDSTTPLFITVIQTFVALVAEWALIYGHLGLPALGIKGVVLGLALAHATSMVFAVRVLFSGESRVHLRRHHMRPDWSVIRQILLLAWPPALQMMSGFLVTVFFIRLMGDLGDKAQAAYSIGLRLSMIGPMVSFPIAGACATLVGQNLGAGDPQRAWQSLRVGLMTHVVLLWSFAGGIFLFRDAILAAFTQDPEVARIGAELLAYQSASFVFIAFNLVFFRALQGAGDVLVPMAMSLGNSLLISLPLGLWLSGPQGMGPTGVFLAGLVSAISITLMTGSWVATGRWTRRKPFAR